MRVVLLEESVGARLCRYLDLASLRWGYLCLNFVKILKISSVQHTRVLEEFIMSSIELEDSSLFPFHPRPSCTYQRLPTNLIKLSVHKLDGSSFEVEVVWTALVSELKQAVENVFCQSPKEGEGKISWWHVWGYFCLCYQGNKLLNDQDPLRTFGIKDGDQLYFIRHLSVYHYPAIKGHQRYHNANVRQHQLSLTGPHVLDSKEENKEKHEETDGCQEDKNYFNRTKEREIILHKGFKFTHFVTGWISCSRLWFVSRRSKRWTHLSRGKELA